MLKSYHLSKIKYISYFAVVGLFLFLLFNSFNMRANRLGILYKNSPTTTGCGALGDCHSQFLNIGVTLTAVSSTGSFTITPGDTIQISITVHHLTLPAAGINIGIKSDPNSTPGANVGTLIPEPDTYLRSMGGELTHTQPKPLSGGQVTFTFTWIAPTAEGSYYLRAAANCVNNNLVNDILDLWNFLNPVMITVLPPSAVTVTSPNGGESFCPGTTQNITWNSSGLSNVNILLSTNGGTSFPQTLASNIDASSGSWQWSIPTGFSPSSQCRIKISDVNLSNYFDISDGNFSINPFTQIIAQPVDYTACSGDTVSFFIVAQGAGLSYRWHKNGIIIPGEESDTLKLLNIQGADAASYTVVVGGMCGDTLTSLPAHLIIGTSPLITEQPVSKKACPGSQVNLSVAATGDNLSYVWKRNGENIPNSNSNNFLILNITESDTGRYSVLIGGLCPPAVESEEVTLSLYQQSRILLQPESKTICEGSDVFFSVEASGDSINYFWSKDGIQIPNTNSTALTISEAKPSDAGIYTVTVFGICQPSVVSSEAILIVNSNPVIAEQPLQQVVLIGSDVTFSVAAEDINTTYQWRKNGENLTGKTDGILLLNSVQIGDAGLYDCILTNGCGETQSDTARLTVLETAEGPFLSFKNNGLLDFGKSLENTPNDTSATNYIYNSGTETLRIDSIVFIPGASHSTDSMSFDIGLPPFPITITAGDSINLPVIFQPGKRGTISANYMFFGSFPNTAILKLNGSGGFVELFTGTDTLDFGIRNLGEVVDSSFFISNNGDLPANLKEMSITQQSDQFSLVNPGTFTFISAGSQVDVNIRFDANQEGDFEGIFNCNYFEQVPVISVLLKGKVIPTGIIENPAEEGELFIYPNPASDFVFFKINMSETHEKTIKIYDVFGKIVKQISLPVSSNDNDIFEWNTSDDSGKPCPPGIYCIRISGVSELIGKNLVIIR